MGLFLLTPIQNPDRLAAKVAERFGVNPSLPDSTPESIHPRYDHSFMLQAVMEMQKTLGELNSAVSTMNASIQSTKAKVDDLVGWKNKILGGAVVLGAVFTLLGFAVSKCSQYVTIAAPDSQVSHSSKPDKK